MILLGPDELFHAVETKVPPSGAEALTVMREEYLSMLNEEQIADLLRRDLTNEVVVIETQSGIRRLSAHRSLH